MAAQLKSDDCHASVGIVDNMNDEEITEDKYNDFCSTCTENMEELIFCTRMPNEVKEIETFWKAAEAMSPIGQSYDEIVQQLQ